MHAQGLSKYPMNIQPATLPSAPFVIQHSVASLRRNMTGIPIQTDNLPGMCSVEPWGNSHNALCKAKLKEFDFRLGFLTLRFLHLFCLLDSSSSAHWFFECCQSLSYFLCKSL